MPYERSPDEIGVLWRNESKAGKVYYKGTINGQAVVGWPGTTKTGKEKIDIKIDRPRDDRPQQESIPAWDDLKRSDEVPF